MDVDLQSVDINQCASGPGWYSNTHLCDLNSTQVRIQRVGYWYPASLPLSHHAIRSNCLSAVGLSGTSASQGFREVPIDETDRDEIPSYLKVRTRTA